MLDGTAAGSIWGQVCPGTSKSGCHTHILVSLFAHFSVSVQCVRGTKDRRRWLHFVYKFQPPWNPQKNPKQFLFWHINNLSIHIPSVWVTASCLSRQSSPCLLPSPMNHTLPPPSPFYIHLTFCDLSFLPSPNFVSVSRCWWGAWVEKRRWKQEPDSNNLYSLNPIRWSQSKAFKEWDWAACFLKGKRKTNKKSKEKKIPAFYRYISWVKNSRISCISRRVLIEVKHSNQSL